MSNPLASVDILAVLRLARRIALAIADGRVDANAVESMTDEDLAAFDETAAAALEAKQKEAEDLAAAEPAA